VRVASESPFGWLAALFAGGVIAGALLWRRDVVLRGVSPPPARPQPEQQPAPSPIAGPQVGPVPPPAPPVGIVPTYTVDSWLAYVQPLAAAAGVPVAYAQQWNQIEANGQPCAVGNRFKAFDGVHPLESGIAQLYGPDDYDALKVDATALRAYCAPRYLAPVLDGKGKPTGRQALAFSQQHFRALTPDEMRVQAGALVGKIALGALRVNAMLGGAWDRSGRDFWTLVKMHSHGLPGLAPSVIAYLKRAPGTWAELRATALDPAFLTFLAAHDPVTYGYRDAIPGVLLNAEKTAAVVAPTPRKVA
jgi:hypothetical protein